MQVTNPTANAEAPGCEQRLADCGIRPTAQRVRIASLLLSGPQHLSAEQILASLRAAGARVSKATVYNTLNLFAGHGLIRQLSVDNSRAWFDSNVEAHYHFHDLSSGALIDVPVASVQFNSMPTGSRFPCCWCMVTMTSLCACRRARRWPRRSSSTAYPASWS